MNDKQSEVGVTPFIYISGSAENEAFNGIEDYRKLVLDALRRMGVYPIYSWTPVENLQLRISTLDQIREQVEQSDFFLGIYVKRQRP